MNRLGFRYLPPILPPSFVWNSGLINEILFNFGIESNWLMKLQRNSVKLKLAEEIGLINAMKLRLHSFNPYWSLISFQHSLNLFRFAGYFINLDFQQSSSLIHSSNPVFSFILPEINFNKPNSKVWSLVSEGRPRSLMTEWINEVRKQTAIKARENDWMPA